MWWSAERPRAERTRLTIGWSAVFALVALVAYVRSVMSGPSPASSLPVKLYALFFPIVLVVLLALY